MVYGGDVNIEPINPLTILVFRTQGVLTTYSVSPLHPVPSCHPLQPSCPCPHPSPAPPWPTPPPSRPSSPTRRPSSPPPPPSSPPPVIHPGLFPVTAPPAGSQHGGGDRDHEERLERFQPDLWDEMDAAAPAGDQDVLGPGEGPGGEEHDGDPAPAHDVPDAGGAAGGGQGSHVEAELLTCEICGKHGFKTKKQLHNHKASHKIVTCKNCKKTFTGNVRWSDHKLRCLKEEPQYQCSICNYKDHSKSNLKRHMKVHKVSPVKLHKCNVCEYETTSPRDMWSHVSRKHQPPQQKYECQKCNKKFVNPNSEGVPATHLSEGGGTLCPPLLNAVLMAQMS